MLSWKSHPLGPFIKAIILSTVLAFLFHYGILMTYNYLPGSVLFLVCMPVFCFLLFWIIIKYERYLEVNEVFYKTIALDFKIHKSKFNRFFENSIRPMNPYIGFLGTLSVLLFVFLALPALIIYLGVLTGIHGMSLGIAVFVMSAGVSLLCFYSKKEDLPSPMDKGMVFIGALIGPLCVTSLFS